MTHTSMNKHNCDMIRYTKGHKESSTDPNWALEVGVVRLPKLGKEKILLARDKITDRTLCTCPCGMIFDKVI